MIIIINQKLLQSFVHDDELRHHLTQALEYESPSNIEKLREFLVHAGYATKVAACSQDACNLPKSEETEK